MKQSNSKINNLRGIAQFVLFATSYIPLFVLIALRQISENSSFLVWGGFYFDSIILCFQKFGLSILSIIISIVGYIGYMWTFQNLEKVSPNGDNVTVLNVDNKNSESIGYIATYIVPFLFQSFNGWYESFALIFLMVIIYRIYINSNLILINPILSFTYSLFEIEYRRQDGKAKNGLIIVKGKHIEEDTSIKIYEMGFKLYYAVKKRNN
jgi:Flagellar biosynthesis/type III secretory pathway lipoprotein